MIYYAPGGTHAPHHPTPEWIKKISDMHLFDKGYNDLREQIVANQRRLGIIPQNAQLTPWQDTIPKWDTLSPDAKKLFIRQADVYGAYLAYTDYEIGRVIQAVEDAGKLDNTLIIYISGDNGASPEGTLNGLYSEYAFINGVAPTVAENMKFYDAWGSDQTYPHYTAGWALAFDTPYQWTKEVASHFGGTRNGMAMAWPARIKDAGGIRTQFHHVIDIVPTILEAAGLPEPVTVNGIAQKPIEGVSMVYSWDKAAANTPSRRTTQYFEMFGSRGIYKDGWIASVPPWNPPWHVTLAPPPPDVMTGFPRWQLYNLNADWTQANDLAASMPDKLRDLQEAWTVEATKHQVFPLDDAVLTRFLAPKPNYNAERTTFTYTGELSNVLLSAAGNAPSLLNRSYTITAEVEVPAGGAEGMLVTDGGRFGGYGFYLLKGKPIFTWDLSMPDVQRVKWQGNNALTPGKHTLEFDFRYDGLGAETLAYNNVSGVGRGGAGTLKVDGTTVSTQTIEHTNPLGKPLDTVFNIGVAAGTPVDDHDYQIPFPFEGTITKITYKVDRPKLTPADVERLKRASLEREKAK